MLWLLLKLGSEQWRGDRGHLSIHLRLLFPARAFNVKESQINEVGVKDFHRARDTFAK